MSLQPFIAFATTRDIDPGAEEVGADGIVRCRDRVFTDVVESDDARVAGVNQPHLALDFDPRDASGRIWGSFELRPASGGSWVGSLTGNIVGGVVAAKGLAHGTGPHEGWVMRVDFQQVDAHPRTPPCPEPKAFFSMAGHLLPRA
jgi:hypothetical protein